MPALLNCEIVLGTGAGEHPASGGTEIGGPGRPWTAGQVLAMSAMMVYAIFPMPAGQENIADFSGLVVVGPVLVFLIWGWLARPKRLNSP